MAAYSKPVVLKPLLDANGDSRTQINKLAKDRDGFLWLSGDGGLYRFDGYRFESIFDEFVHDAALLIDRLDRVWLSGLYSLIQIDTQETVIRHFEKLQSDTQANETYLVRSIRETKKGVIIAATTYGISIYSEDLTTLKSIPTYIISNGLSARTPIYSMELIDDELLMLATDEGVFTYPVEQLVDINTNRIDLTDSIVTREAVRKILKIDSNRYVFTNRSGFTYFDFASEKTMRYQNTMESKILDHDSVNAVHAINSEEILIGTNLGLNILDLRTLKIVSAKDHFKFEGSNDIQRVMGIQEIDGHLFITTSKTIYTTSVMPSKLSQSRKAEPILYHKNSKPYDIINNLWAIESSIEYGLMLGTVGSGVVFIADDDGFTQVRRSSGELSSDAVSSFLVDKDGGLWVGTAYGISYAKKRGDALKPLALLTEDPIIGSDSIRGIIQADDTTIWILSVKWLIQIDSNMEILQHYDFNTAPGIDCTKFASTFLVLKGKALIGCENGLAVIDTINKVLIKKFDTATVTRILQDSNNNVWVLDFNQLYSFNEHTTELIATQSPEFFSHISKEIFANMIEDKNSQLWISYLRGIFVFDIETRIFLKNFGKGSVFENHNVLFGKDAMHLSDTGDILVGDTAGLTYFTPVKLPPPAIPKIAISKIKETFKKNSKLTSRYLKVTSITDTSKTSVIFDHRLEKIEFEFTDIDIDRTHPTFYQYYLEGAEEHWNKPNENRTVSYLGLKPGTYTLHVKSLKNLQYSDEILYSFTISVHPLWSLTAKTIYLLFLAALIFILSRLRARSLQKKVDILEERVVKRTQELVDKNSDIEQLLKEKEVMIENIFHQTRTPIQLLIANMDELKSGEMQIPIYVEKQSSNIQGLVELTDRVLNNVRKDNTELTHQNLDLMFSQFAERYSLIAKQRSINFSFQCDTPLDVVTNIDLLQEIVDNLLSNAIKYTQEGHIKFSVRINNEHLWLTVKDSGQGIASDQLENILNRGYREDGVSEAPGNGIGLSIVNTNIDWLGGKLLIESEIRKGSKFIVKLPVGFSALELEAQQQIELNDKKHVNPEAVEILLIEDNVELANYYLKELKKDYSVTIAHSGEEAIKIATRDVPNIVISDVMMQGISGFDVVSALRQNPITRHIPMILLTAKADQRSKLQGFKVGANDYIVKPVQPHELSLRVRNQLSLVCHLEKHILDDGVKNRSLDHGDEIVNKFIGLVQTDFADPQLNSDDIATSLHITKKQLERKVKQVLDTTPKQFLIEYRLGRARIHLSRGEKASRVFEVCGFSSHAYFSKKFKDKYGYTPSSVSSLELAP